jgi:IclR helix-turn-helix domain
MIGRRKHIHTRTQMATRRTSAKLEIDHTTAEAADSVDAGGRSPGIPQKHRTVDRVTSILEEVVYNPGMTSAELARALDAPKSSVCGFISGLLAKGWLYRFSTHRIAPTGTSVLCACGTFSDLRPARKSGQDGHQTP